MSEIFAHRGLDAFESVDAGQLVSAAVPSLIETCRTQLLHRATINGLTHRDRRAIRLALIEELEDTTAPFIDMRTEAMIQANLDALSGQ